MSFDIKRLFSQISNDNWSDEFENNLCYSLNCFTDDLIKNGYTEQADWIWKKAIELANNRSRFLSLSYAKHLSSRSLYIEAFEILSNCSNIYPDYAPVYDAIENTKNLIVDRWHFRMLNDQFRNNSYFKALEWSVKKISSPNCTVLDIGGGTGLLSCYAILAGASHVYCCEMNPSLVSIATVCIEANNFSDKITLISKHSKDLMLGVDIPHKVSIIVTELVDSGLLGEHIIETLYQAREALLMPSGIVIPHSAHIYGQLIHSQSISRRNRILSSTEYVCDENMTLHPFIKEIRKIQEKISFSLLENYTCENINELTIDMLSQPQKLMEIILDGNQNQSQNNLVNNLALTIERDGLVDGIMTWFNMFLINPMYLTNTEEHEWNVISTQPNRSLCGWDQAIYFSSKFIDNNPSVSFNDFYSVSQGNIVILSVFFLKDKLTFGLSKTEPLEATVLNDYESCLDLFIEDIDMSLVNDIVRFNCFISEIYEFLLINFKSSRPVRILEIAGGLQSPGFWINMLLSAYNKGTLDLPFDSDHLFSVLNVIKYTRLLVSSDVSQCLQSIRSEFLDRKNLSLQIVSDSIVESYDEIRYNLVIFDGIESSGLISQNALKDLKFALEMMVSNSAEEMVKVVPSAISIITTAIECLSLYEQHSVIRQRTLEVF